MKFGRVLEDSKIEKYQRYYISYKDLKKAIKIFCGNDRTGQSVQDVVTAFGNIPALGGSIFRPPEAVFHDLLQEELDKINGIVLLEEERLLEELRIYKAGYLSARNRGLDLREILKNVIQLEEFINLNHTGFRKITKKYDKHSTKTSSAWFMAMIDKQSFKKVDWNRLFMALSDAGAVSAGIDDASSTIFSADLQEYPSIISVNLDTPLVQDFLVDYSDDLKVKAMISVGVPLLALRREMTETFYDFDDFRGYKAHLKGYTAESVLVTADGDNYSASYKNETRAVINLDSFLQGKSDIFPSLKTELRQEKLHKKVVISFIRTEWQRDNVRVIMDTNITYQSCESCEGQVTNERFPWHYLSVCCGAGSSLPILREVVGRATIRKISGFSKHLHAVAACFNDIGGFPHWYRDTILESSSIVNNDSQPYGKYGDAHQAPNFVSMQMKGTAARVMHEVYTNANNTSLYEEEERSLKDRNETLAENYLTPALSNRYNTPGSNYRSKPMTLYNQAAEGKQPSPGRLHTDLSERLLSATRREDEGSESPLCPEPKTMMGRIKEMLAPSINRGMRKAVVRVEPKTHFSNDRTLLDWVQCFILYSISGIAMIRSSNNILFAGGVALVPISMLLLLYAIKVYHNRARSLKIKEITDYSSILPLGYATCLIIQVFLSIVMSPVVMD